MISMNKKLLAAYGLKWNPFAPDVPTEGFWQRREVEHFSSRVETLIQGGGFALITGDPGTGKSSTLRGLEQRLGSHRDLTVASLTHTQCSMGDFYRELGHLFSVRLSASNRWGGFKTLRDRWQAHLNSTLLRPVLLIDEAQMMRTDVLNELRLLTSKDFDSTSVLTVVLAGDDTLPPRLGSDALLPLASRIRIRLPLGSLSQEDLLAFLEHGFESAGNPRLMTAELKQTLVEHAGGNLRTLTQLADDVLQAALAQEAEQLDERLYLELCTPGLEPRTPARRSARRKS